MSMAHQLVQMAMIRMKGGSASVEEIRMPVNLIKTVALIVPLEEIRKEIQGLEDHFIQLVTSLTIEIMETTIANENITATIPIGETTTIAATTTITTTIISAAIETISITAAIITVKAVIHIRDTVVGLLQRIIPGMLRILDNLQWRMVAIHMILRLLEDITVILKMEAGKELLRLLQDIRHTETARMDTIMARTMHHLWLAVMVRRLVLLLALEQVMATVVMHRLFHLNMPTKR